MWNGVDNKDKSDNAWYSDDEINTLLDHYRDGNQEVELLTAMLGTDWRDREVSVLKDNLIQFNQQRRQQRQQGQAVRYKVLVPVNLVSCAGTIEKRH